MSAIYYGNDANGLFYGADTERKGLPDRPTQSAEAPARARPFARPGRGFPGPGPRSGPASLASGWHRGLQRVVCLWGQGPRGALSLLPRLLSETETAAAHPPSGSQAPGALADPQGCSLPPALLGTRGPSGKSPTAAVQRPWSGLAEGQRRTPTSGFHWGFWKPDGGVSGPFK